MQTLQLRVWGTKLSAGDNEVKYDNEGCVLSLKDQSSGKWIQPIHKITVKKKVGKVA